jgi:predicted lipoprotein with Yx(FWY)xxD motif
VRSVLFALAVLLVASGVAGAQGSSTASVKAAYNAKLKTVILVNAQGLTLYAFTDDVGGTPTCYDDIAYHCAKAWPPLRSTTAPLAGKGVKASLLKLVKNPDGYRQVSYNKHPLYTDAGAKGFGLTGDRKPGDDHGQGFANAWYAVSPTGKLIKRAG